MAAGMRLRKASSGHDRDAARAALSEVLADARGIPMKVGQLLAANGDRAFETLVTGVPPLAPEVAKRAVEAALGQPMEAVFGEFDTDARAASLGQVHHARLRDGAEVAVKVRYPGIMDAVKAELRLAGLLPGLGPVRRWGFDLDGYRQVLDANMTRELDYRSEAAYQTRFREDVRVSGLRVPGVVPHLVKDGLIVQSWEHGTSLSDALPSYGLADRLHVGRTLLETLFASVFRVGLVHGDPHPGNYLFRRGADGRPEVVLLDFGCVVEVPAAARMTLLRLLLDLREGRPTDAFSAFVAVGFDGEKLTPIAHSLERVAEALFQPFLSDGPFDVTAWQLGSRIDDGLGELKWWFRSAGPPELFLLLRAFQGVVRQLATLDIRLPWWPLLCRAVGDETLDAARRHDVPRAEAAPLPEARARLLRVRIVEGSAEKFTFTAPARVALRLGELVPPDVVEKVQASGISIEAIERRLSREGLAPGSLFTYESAGKNYRAWLE